MIRRSLATCVLAATLAAAPTAAMASGSYPPPEDALSVTSQQVAPGGDVQVSVGGPAGSDAQIQVTSSGENATIAGTVTSAVKVIEADSTPAQFTVTVPAASGAIGITALLDGVAVDTATITVVTDAAAARASAEELSLSGPEVVGIAVAAIALLGGGAAVAVAARRRREDD